MLVLLFFLGQFYYPLIFITILLSFLRIDYKNTDIGFIYFLLILMLLLGSTIILTRSIIENVTLIVRFLFIWLTPLVILFNRPSKDSLNYFHTFAKCIFFIDFAINISSILYGSDILFRNNLDEREGFIFSIRLGGLFGNSFASGVYSILFLMTDLEIGNKNRKTYLFPLINFLLIGSWRFIIIFLLYFIYKLWKNRKLYQEIISIAIFSVLTVLLTFFTSSLSSVTDIINKANDLRIYAWLNSMIKIYENPFWGYGFIDEKSLEYISEETIDEFNIAESWYLADAINFGLIFLAIKLLFFIHFYLKLRKSKSGYVFMPIFFIDLVYAGVYESYIIYLYLWVIYVTIDVDSPQILMEVISENKS